MITCRDLVELMLELESGTLEIEHQNNVKQHLNGCASCAAYFETYRLTIHMSRRLPRAPLPEQLKRKLLEIMEESDFASNPTEKND